MFRDLTFLHGNYVPDHHYVTDRHYIDYYSLKLMTRGRVKLRYDSRSYVLEGAWFWPAYPGPHIHFYATSESVVWEHRYVTFRGSLVEQWQAAGLWWHDPQAMPLNRDFPRRFDVMLQNMEQHDRWSKLRAVNLLEQILIDLADDRAKSVRRPPWLMLVLDELHTTKAFVPDYRRLAARCHMGLSTLRRRFKEAMGLSLHAYVMRSRMATARDLLISTDMPIGQIADQLGYRDVHFFSTQFRMQIGLSPSAYRQSGYPQERRQGAIS